MIAQTASATRKHPTTHNELIESLYREYYYTLLHFLSAMTSDKQLIEDIIQDVFITLIKNTDVVVDPRYVKSYLQKSVRNRMIDWYRKAKPAFFGDDDRVGQLPDESCPFEKELELTDEIRQTLDKLPDHYRFVILARDYYGYSYQEIAKLTGSSSSSMKTKIFRARKQFIHYYQSRETGLRNNA